MSDTENTTTATVIETEKPAVDKSALEDKIMGREVEPTETVEKPAEPVVEAAPVKPAEPSAEDEWLERFEQIKRQEKAMRVERQKLKAMENELKELRELKAMAATNPLEFAKKTGLSLKDFADQTIDSALYSDKQALKQLQSTVEQMKVEKEEFAKQQEEERIRQNSLAYINRTRQVIASGAEYELLKATGDEGLQIVLDAVQEHYKNSEQEIPLEQFCTWAETYLEKRETDKLKRLAGTGKFKNKLTELMGLPKNDINEQTKPGALAVSDESKKPRNITNSIASSPAAKEVGGKKSKEEWARLKKELENKLFD